MRGPTGGGISSALDQRLTGLFSQRPAAPLPRLELKNGETPVAVPEGQAGTVARDLQQVHRTDAREDVREYLSATTRLTKIAIMVRLKQEGLDTKVSSVMVQTLSKLCLGKYAMSTLKDYTNSMLLYERYCHTMQCRFLPLDVFEFAACICQMGERLNLEQKTASSVDNLVAGVSCFVNIAGGAPPTEDPFVSGAQDAVQRHLGYKDSPKDTLLQEHIVKMVELKGDSVANVETIATLARIALSQTALLRFDDLAALKMGHFVFTQLIVRLFLVRTKTDKYAKGQWSSFFVNEDEEASPYALVVRLLATLVQTWDLMSAAEKKPYSKWTDPQDGSLLLAEIPFMFKTVSMGEKQFPAPPGVSSATTRTSLYNMYLAKVKEYSSDIGLDPTKYGTHSGRRGGATAAVEAGVEDELIMQQGRWRSKMAFNRYICDELELRQRAAAFLAAHLGGSSTKASVEGAREPPNKKKTGGPSKEVLSLGGVAKAPAKAKPRGGKKLTSASKGRESAADGFKRTAALRRTKRRACPKKPPVNGE